MTDEPIPDEPFDPADPMYDVSDFMRQLNEVVADALGGDGTGEDDSPGVTVLEMPKSALAILMQRLGLFEPVEEDDDDTPWETLVEGQLKNSMDFLPNAPRMTVVTWLIGDYHLQWTRRKDARSKQERVQYTEMMCLHLARIVVVARFINKKYRPDYSRTSRGHKKTVDLLLLRTAQHRWDDMGDIAAQRLYTLMGGGR